MSAVERHAPWPIVRMRDLLIQGMRREQRKALLLAEQVSFLPMEAIGEQGSLDLSAIRDKEDVAGGYTQFFDGDVLVAKITPCFENGKGAIAHGLLNGVGFGTTELHILRPGPDVDARFLYYVTASPVFRQYGEASMVGAAGQKRVPTEFILNYSLVLPSLDEQRAIADYLDRETAEIDAMIAAKERLLELLAEKRRALVTEGVTRGLDAGVALRDSGVGWLGEIPAHWSAERIKVLISGIDSGFSPQCYNFPANEGEWGVVKAGCVNDGIFDENDNKALPEDILPLVDYEIMQGDVLMSRASGSTELIGSVALVVNQPKARLLLSDKIYRLRLNPFVCDPTYFVAAMGAVFVRQQIRQIISGAEGLANNIAQADVRELLLAVPPIEEQKRIAVALEQKLQVLDALYNTMRGTIELLNERRTVLIGAAVTGQLQIVV